MDKHKPSGLTLKRLGIDTHKEYIVYMRSDCQICRSEGYESMTRLYIRHKSATIIATLNVVKSNLLEHNEASLSEYAWQSLGACDGDLVFFSHLEPVDSLRHVRSKMYGVELDGDAYFDIVRDISDNKYANIELAAFITACAGDSMSLSEITHLTDAMVRCGKKMSWAASPVLDKHSVGGLPGNRTSPIIVAIIAACGLTMPKTSSRAITSSSGTADTMETITNVRLNMDQIKSIVQQQGACLAWGGNVALSPSDDVLIKVEKALDVDSEGQMIASVLSKKIAAGSTHVVIDMPVGPTAKVRTIEDAIKLAGYFCHVSKSLGIHCTVIRTDGNQPVGVGIGPALEAHDVLKVLQNHDEAPDDLRERALMLASALLELTGFYSAKAAIEKAREVLSSGLAFNKFKQICLTQGKWSTPGHARYTWEIKAEHEGIITEVDNRKLAKIAKLSGAPESSCAGLEYLCTLGQTVKKGDLLLRVHSESIGELNYALDYFNKHNNIIRIL